MKLLTTFMGRVLPLSGRKIHNFTTESVERALMVNAARATNVSSHATTADHVRGIAHQLPPRRTGHADFPHPALRQSLASKHLQGVDGVQLLQVDQPIALQSSVQPLSLPKRLAPPLAPTRASPVISSKR